MVLQEKKAFRAKEQVNAHVVEWKAAYEAHVRDIPLEKLVFIDESGVTTAMTRQHARSRRGERVKDVIPRNRGGVLRLLGALSTMGLIAMGTINGATSTDVFLAWIEQVLIPELVPGQVVVMSASVTASAGRAGEGPVLCALSPTVLF